MKQLNLIYTCFGLLGSLKYLGFKSVAFFIRIIFRRTGSDNKFLARLLEQLAGVTDNMVADYIFDKYYYIFIKYIQSKEDSISNLSKQPQRIIWTVWLQGKNNMPEVVRSCIRSFYKQAPNYEIIIVTLQNVEEYLDIAPEILAAYRSGKISAAHLADYLRVSLLKEYGGVWMDATMYLTKPIPEFVWEYDYLLWNRVVDMTSKNAYVSIPFVKRFNNGFMVSHKNSLFFQFATEITSVLLFDNILELDYFAVFKAYLRGIDQIPVFFDKWKQMPEFNIYGLVARQFWNQPLSRDIKDCIDSPQSFFFPLTYKKSSKNIVANCITVQNYIMTR